MSTAATRRDTGAGHFTGIGFLIRFYLHLDRKRIGIWASSFLVLIYSSVLAMEAAYPTAEALQGRASLLNNPATIMMTGPAFSLDDYTFGAMLANELALWTFLPAAIMGILLVVRHTRQDEETGRMETLRALAIGRYAPTAATLVVTLVATIAVAAAVTIALAASGQVVADSAAFGLGTGLIGLFFGAVAALTSQLTEHARTASAAAMGALALAAIIRGFGDVIEPTGSWLSWLSPIAWVQQTKLYVDLRWWPLLLVLVATLAVAMVTLQLSRRRDLGAGLVPPRPGPREAAQTLLNPYGIANRFLSGTFIGWTIGLAMFAVTFGTLANSLDTFVEDNPAISGWVPLSTDDLTTSFAAIILSMLAIGPIILVITTILRLKSEEQGGHLDLFLVTGNSRGAMLGAWVTVATCWAAVSMIILGLSTGIGLAAVTGKAVWILDLTVASLAYLPAILIASALTTVLYSAGLRYTFIAWIFLVFVTLDTYLGDLFNLPSWLRGLSPVWQTPLIPYESWNAVPLIVMTGLAGLMYAAAHTAFRRRDLAAN